VKTKRIWVIAPIATVVAAAIWYVTAVLSSEKILPLPNLTVRKKSALHTNNPHLKNLLRNYEQELNKLLVESGTPGAAVAVVYDSAVVFMRGFGRRASNSFVKVDAHTVFRIASVSKPFASFLTGILVQDSVLRWEDKVTSYIPQFQLQDPEATAALEIEHLLSHTTGLPYHTYTNLVEEGTDLWPMLERLREVKLANAPGEQYSYQNVAFSLIGEIIRQRTGLSYEDQLRNRVFLPLNMGDASLNYDSIMNNPNHATPHRKSGAHWVPAKINNTYYNVAPAGGVNASISDMAAWMTALLGYRPDVVSQQTLDRMYKPYVEARSRNRNYSMTQRITDAFYGLGWRIVYYPNDTLVYHGGYVTGFRSEIGLDPSDKISVCILANAPGDLADKAVPLFFSMYQLQRDSIIAWTQKELARP